MDLFEFPDDYKPERPLTDEESDEITNYLKNHPLFMKNLPENIQDNEHLVALQQLVEDDPVQEAQILNKQANARLKENPENRAFQKEAYGKYTDAINLKCQSAATNAKLHANRAALNLRLRNYGKVIEDCKICLKFDFEYAKGYYRYAKALIALKKYKECLQLIKSREEPQIKELAKEAENKLLLLTKKTEEKKSEISNEKNQIQEYFKKKNWRFAKREEPLPEGAQIKLVDPLLISLPLVILYPQFKQFDLIASALETQKLWPQLSEMIAPGLPWDAKKEYKMDTIEVYCQVAEAVLMKIPKQVNIGDVAARVVIREALEFLVVCKNSQFYKVFMSQYKVI